MNRVLCLVVATIAASLVSSAAIADKPVRGAKNEACYRDYAFAMTACAEGFRFIAPELQSAAIVLCIDEANSELVRCVNGSVSQCTCPRIRDDLHKFACKQTYDKKIGTCGITDANCLYDAGADFKACNKQADANYDWCISTLPQKNWCSPQ